MTDGSGELLAALRRLGENDPAVSVVSAVRGRSRYADEMAAFEVVGSAPPVNSIFRILAFRSSSSSQTVEGAVVDTVDAVPSSIADWNSGPLLDVCKCDRGDE